MSSDTESAKRKPASFSSSNLSAETRAVKEELRELHDMQLAAIKRATFLGMTLTESKEFERRGTRIRQILAALGRNAV